MSHLLKSKLGLFLFILGVGIVTSIFALDTWNTGYKNPDVTVKAVRVGGDTAQTCYRSYNTAGKEAFIPTKTGGQYNSVNNHPNMKTGCYRNLALNRYVHNNNYNYPITNGGECKRDEAWNWDGLTEGHVNDSKADECKSNRGKAVWASRGRAQTHNMRVSIDLGGRFIINKVKVWDEIGPDIGEVTGINGNTRDVQVYIKDGTSAASCYAASASWTYIGVHRFAKVGGTSFDYTFTNQQARCVMLRFPVGNNHGGWRTENGYDNSYAFIRELEVHGF